MMVMLLAQPSTEAATAGASGPSTENSPSEHASVAESAAPHGSPVPSGSLTFFRFGLQTGIRPFGIHKGIKPC